MKKVIPLILGLIISIGLFATKHNHSDENEVRYVKGKPELNKQYQEQLRNTQLWQNFNYNYPDWFVIFNERNQLPHRAFGTPIPVNDLQSFLILQDFILPNDLRELSISELQNKIIDLKKELMDSRFSLATSQLEDTSVFKKIKKEIAQANTVLTEKINKESIEEV